MSTIIYLMKYFMSVPAKNSLLSLPLTLIYPAAPVMVCLFQINNNNNNDTDYNKKTDRLKNIFSTIIILYFCLASHAFLNNSY